MSQKPPLPPPVVFDYMDAANAGDLHSFVTQISASILAKLEASGKKVGCTMIYNNLESLGTMAKKFSGEPFEVGNPLPNLTSCQYDASENNGLNKWKEEAYLFHKVCKKPVFAMNIMRLKEDYYDVFSCKISVIMAETEEDAEAFVHAYRAMVNSSNRDELPCVLGIHGRRNRTFRPMAWDEIFLAGNMLQDIRSEIETFFKSREMYEEYGLYWRRGILLTGKPGDGKTSICRAIATSSPNPVIYITLNTSDAFGLLDEVEATIAENSPCVAIFEDADSIGADTMLRSRFLNMLDGMCSQNGVMTIATTNSPDKLDAAFTGRPSRFDSLYVVEDPTAVEIERIIRKRLGSKDGVSKADMAVVVKVLGGLSAAAAQEAAVCSLLKGLGRRRKICGADLLETAKKVRKHMIAAKEGLENTRRGEGFSAMDEVMHSLPFGRSGKKR